MKMSAKLCLIIVMTLSVASLALAASPSAQTPQELSQFAGWKGAAPRSDDAFNFVVLSDHSSSQIPGQWEAAVKEVNLLRPDFVMTVGDVIPGYMQDEAGVTKQWEEVEAINAKIEAPFFYCLGNHDATNTMMYKLYVDRHGMDGRSYYSFNYRGCHFVVLDTLWAANIAEFMDKELAWLAEDMAAAKDARHVFVFYHNIWNPLELWPKIAALLPAEKTTIFSGHTHKTGYRALDGIPNYVLGPTAAKASADDIRMFALVSVDEGKPTVTLVTMNSVLPSGYAELAGKLNSLLDGAKQTVISPDGGSYTFAASNPLDQPITFKLSWEAQGWTIAPEASELTLQPGEKGERSFELSPTQSMTGWPTFHAACTVHNPYLDRDVDLKKSAWIGARLEQNTRLDARISVDGDLGDWLGIEPLTLNQSERVFEGRENWTSAADASCSYRVASDGERLFVAVDVTDDAIQSEPLTKTPSDSVEIFWDARPEDRRDDNRVLRTGHITLCVPQEGQEPRVVWDMQNRPIPEGLKAVCKRRDGGYVIEFSLPLKAMCMPDVPPAPGRAIRIGLLMNDCDPGAASNEPTVTRLSASGTGNELKSTAAWSRWVLDR